MSGNKFNPDYCACEKCEPIINNIVTEYKECYSELSEKLKAAEADLERERMCHTACGVIALSNTPESLEKNRKMHYEYLSASVQDCIRMAEREIDLIAKLNTAVEALVLCNQVMVLNDNRNRCQMKIENIVEKALSVIKEAGE